MVLVVASLLAGIAELLKIRIGLSLAGLDF